MFCRYCGNELEDDEEFCPKCGKSQVNIPNDDVTPSDPEEWSPQDYDEKIQEFNQSTASQGSGDSNQPKRRIRGLVITIVILAIIAALAIFFLLRTTIRQNSENEVVQEEVQQETQSEEVESEEIAADSPDTVETEEIDTEEVVAAYSDQEEAQSATDSTEAASESSAVVSEDNVEAVVYEPGTNAQDGTMLPLDTYVNITLQRGEYAWCKFRTGDVNNASYMITVVDKVNKTNEVDVTIKDDRGETQGSLTANGEGGPTTCTCTKLAANTAYNIEMYFGDISWYDDTLDYVDVDMIIREVAEE